MITAGTSVTSALLLLALLTSPLVHSARILGMLPIGAKSHHRSLEAIMKALAEAGHDVVVYSPFPLENPPPNYTNVYLENMSTKGEKVDSAIQAITRLPKWKCLDFIWVFNEWFFQEFIEDKQIQRLIKSNERFDLVITEAYSVQEFALIFGQVFNAPVVALQTFMTNNVVNSATGNTLSMAYIPDACFGFSNRMTFVERSINSFSILRGLYYYYNWYLPRVEKDLKRHFTNVPPITEMIRNVSLTIVCDHLTADYAFPRPPNIISIAGIHIPPPKALPQGIQKFMDEAPQGVILFSMGSLVPDELFPQSYFDMYVNVFKRLRQRVLWKTRKENIEGLPMNVMTSKWLPQPDVLAHPNCVLFITHGGLNSQHEAIHFGVPVVGIPQFYDQHRNVRFYEAKQVGVKLDSKDLTEKTISAAIHTVTDNPVYMENMKRLSQIYRDRPMTPAQSVVYWTEYVLRHRGAGHLRPASVDLTWYQLALLDVLAVIVSVLVTVVMAGCLVFRKVLSLIRGGVTKSVSNAKKRN